MISTVWASLFMFVICLTANSAFAQTATDSSMMMKDCCMMTNGKMMQMKSGKMMPMEKEMMMENGTKCMPNGTCIMKDGTKMQMKNGMCMDMSGNMEKCNMMNKDTKGSMEKSGKHDMAAVYTCPMHPEVMSDKAGKCPKCGMDLVEKK